MICVIYQIFHIKYIRRNHTILKRLLAIFLLFNHLFTLTGYHVMFDHLEKGTDRHMADRLDTDDYHPDDLIELRIPLQLPYQTGWATDERVDGEIDIDGVHYNYVTRRLVNDTLVMQVIPNHEKTKIRHARETFYALVNDLHDLDTGKRSHSFPPPPRKPFAYEAAGIPSSPLWPGIPAPARLWVDKGSFGLFNQSVIVPDPPPDPLV